MSDIGVLSIVPAALAIILAFLTKDAILALAIASISGFLLLGKAIWNYPSFLIDTMANDSFAWVFFIEILIGILIALFQLSGVSERFKEISKSKKMSRRKGMISAWLAGLAVFFSDYFSPIFVGTALRPLTDKLKISREKLSYIADSTSSPLIVIIPFTSWAIYVSGIIQEQIPGMTKDQSLAAFSSSIAFNFYAIGSVILVGLICTGIVKDFGPMKAAENRAIKHGKVVRDGSRPMIGKELDSITQPPNLKTSFLLNFIIPVMIIISTNLGSYLITNSAKIVESFSAAILYLIVTLSLQKAGIKTIIDSSITGIKSIMPAVMILLFAYALNSISKDAGTAHFLVEISRGIITPELLPAIIFIVSSIIAFSTGTSWGTFAITIPIASAMALELTGSTVSPLFYMAIAAATGGGVFGDHCSPLSDTSVLASIGAGSDHMDHIRTQLPYAIVVAAATILGYLLLGYTF